jgi:hypothetical protein
MITLKSGTEIEYNEDFDVFFQNILEKGIVESRKLADEKFFKGSEKTYNDLFLKEIMDNAIFIVHQLSEMSKKNRKLAEFIMTGFLFNSIIMTLSKFDGKQDMKDRENIH